MTRWCGHCGQMSRHNIGSKFLYCSICKSNNYDAQGNPVRYWEEAIIHPKHHSTKEDK